MLPTFQTPNGQSEKDYLRELAREGWKLLLDNKITDEQERKTYGDRFRKEYTLPFTSYKPNISDNRSKSINI